MLQGTLISQGMGVDTVESVFKSFRTGILWVVADCPYEKCYRCEEAMELSTAAAVISDISNA